MEFDKILELIHAVSDSSLTNFQMEEGNLKISMKTDKCVKNAPVIMETYAVQPAGQTTPQPAVQEETVPAENSGNVVKCPLVGTFYASSSPEEGAFVQVGDVVKKGQTLGIVEAMKLMNEIESEYDGTVAEILVENEQVV